MTDLKFAGSHNLKIVLDEPPVAHGEVKSVIHELRECCLSTALTVNPVVYQDIIREFWKTTKLKKGNNSVVVVEADVKGCKFVIIEQSIRDALLIDDQSTFPTEIVVDVAQEILDKMGYEGKFPPTIKKLLPPYWRFLAHIYVTCISGRRTGADEISLRKTRGIIALAVGIDFNFSIFILDEFVVNINAKTRDTLMMYPRFIQLFIDV